MNQNYITNRLIKELVDKNQVGYIDPEQQEEEVPAVSANNKYTVIITQADYEAALADNTSGLSKYYAKYPREDSIDAEGHPIRDPDTEVAGHSWEAAITAPTDPAETSSFPWIAIAYDNFAGELEIKYDGETKFTKTITSDKIFNILSVPNDLHMTDYRLVWGTGANGEKTLNPELVEVTFTPSTE